MSRHPASRAAVTVQRPTRRERLRRFFQRCEPESIIEVLEPLATPARQARLQEVFAARIESVTLVMDAPHDPHNGAAVLRSCDAFGVHEVHIVERVEPFAASGAVAKGTERWVDAVGHPDVPSAVAALRAGGFTLVGTHPRGELTPDDLPRIARLALVMGNEHDGICGDLAQACDTHVRIPMRGFVESLNVSVSAAILLSRATEGRTGDLSPLARRRLYARGLAHSVPRAFDVLAARGIDVEDTLD